MPSDRVRTAMGSVVVSGVTVACIFNGGCQTSSTSYIASKADSYIISKGQVIRAQSVHSLGVEPLSDGLAMPISQDGAKATMQFCSREETFELAQGDILVQAEDADFILKKKEAR